MRLDRRRNPFQPSNVVEPELFRGREREIGVVAKALSAAYHGDPVSHVLLTGERGIGKTSLLRFCERMAQDDLPGETTDFDFLVVSVTLAGVEDSFEITQRIADRLGKALDAKGVGNPGVRSIVDFLLNWEVLGVHYHRPEGSVTGDQALGTLIDKIIETERLGLFQGQFITMDEADGPPVSADLGRWCKDFCERLFDADGRKTVLALAGQASLAEKLKKSHGSSLRLFEETDVPILSMEERHDVLRTSMRRSNARSEEPVEMTEQAEARLAELSEGYPYFLQTYAQKAFEAAVEGKIDIGCVERSATEATASIGTKFFGGIYSDAATSENYRVVLHAMADFGTKWLSRQEIAELVDGLVSRDNVSNALRRMKNTDALEAHPTNLGQYRLPTNAFAAWLKLLDEAD